MLKYSIKYLSEKKVIVNLPSINAFISIHIEFTSFFDIKERHIKHKNKFCLQKKWNKFHVTIPSSICTIAQAISQGSEEGQYFCISVKNIGLWFVF